MPPRDTALTSPPPCPDASALREAAIAHLARFATTQAGLTRVLERRLLAWGRRAERAGLESETIAHMIAQSRPGIPAIIESLHAIGAVDDQNFSESRARSLTRSGRSRRGVAAHLAQRGVDSDVRDAAMEKALGAQETAEGRYAELGAALVLARKRRLGPWERPLADDMASTDAASDPRAARLRALAVFARAGFDRDVADRALDLDPKEAEDLLLRLRAS